MFLPGIASDEFLIAKNTDQEYTDLDTCGEVEPHPSRAPPFFAVALHVGA